MGKCARPPFTAAWSMLDAPFACAQACNFRMIPVLLRSVGSWGNYAEVEGRQIEDALSCSNISVQINDILAAGKPYAFNSGLCSQSGILRPAKRFECLFNPCWENQDFQRLKNDAGADLDTDVVITKIKHRGNIVVDVEVAGGHTEEEV